MTAHLVPSANRGATAVLRRRPYKHMRCCPHDAILSCSAAASLRCDGLQTLKAISSCGVSHWGRLLLLRALLESTVLRLFPTSITSRQNNAKARLSMTQTPCTGFGKPLRILLIQHDSCMTKVSHQLCSKISWVRSRFRTRQLRFATRCCKREEAIVGSITKMPWLQCREHKLE